MENGTVIDHIPSEKLFTVVSLLGLEQMNNNITIGFNLKSKKLGTKGIIKIADKFFCDDEINRIAVVAPNVKLNIIRDYEVDNFLTHTFLKVFQIGITNLLDEQSLVYRLYDSDLVYPFSFKADSHANFLKSHTDKVPNRGSNPGSYDIIRGFILLQNSVHGTHVIFCVSPIPFGGKITHINLFLHTQNDT